MTHSFFGQSSPDSVLTDEQLLDAIPVGELEEWVFEWKRQGGNADFRAFVENKLKESDVN